MCGIAGFIKTNGFNNNNIRDIMLLSMKHRGPDSNGYWEDELCSLFHTRLKIIDLSDAASQPMHSSCGRYVMVYNGEVYNYKELSKQFSLCTKSYSDTEVVLEMFARKEINSFSFFNGMFAFAVWDKDRKILTLTRDRIGIKPLYYFWDDGFFAFASELKTLIELPYIKKNLKINQHAVNLFLHLGYVPSPHTIYKNIFKLEGGHFLVFEKGKLTKERWWDIFEFTNEGIINNEIEAIETLKTLLFDSVRLHLISDVPIGCFLSGGIDSSVITSIASSITNKKIKAFTIALENSEMNEAYYAKNIAKHLNIEHHEINVNPKEVLQYITDICTIYDEPFADSSAIPTLVISKYTRESVPVALSGDGGDELFWGYGSYRWAERLENFFVKILRSPLFYLLNQGNSRYRRASWLFDFDANHHIQAHIFSQEQYLFSIKELNNIGIKPNMNDIFLLPEKINNRKLSPAERQSLFDLLYYLPDDLLVKVDRASMAMSLETRVPFLDYRIISFALRLSPKLKYRNNQTKYILKRVLYQFLPEELFSRPKKGFSIPLRQWMRNDLYEYVLDQINGQELKELLGVSVQNIKAFKRWLMGDDLYYNRVWQLVILSQFLKNSKNYNSVK